MARKSKPEPERFVDSFGGKSTPTGKTSSPNLNWKPDGHPLVTWRKTIRTDEDRKTASDFLNTLTADFHAYKAYMADKMEPYRKDKERMLTNSEAVLTACVMMEGVVEKFNVLVKQLAEAHGKKDIPEYKRVLYEINKLCGVFSAHSKRVKMRQTLPEFMSGPRTFAAIIFTRIQEYRDSAELWGKRMEMTPAQLAAADRASKRMQAQWAFG